MNVDTDTADPIVSVNKRGWGEPSELSSGAITKFTFACPTCGIMQQAALPRLRALLWGMLRAFVDADGQRVVELPLDRLDHVLAAVPRREL